MRGAIAVLLAGSLLGGCAFQPQLHSVAVDHNRLVADTANELTLLNILRASQRQPMHFTSMSVLRGNAQLTIGGEIGSTIAERAVTTERIPAAGALATSKETANNGPESFTPRISGSIVTNPNFEIGVYDKKDFQAGIMTPISAATYQYLQSNGYSHKYLARLLIERIEFHSDGSPGQPAKGETVGVIDNDPTDDAAFNVFEAFLEDYTIDVQSVPQKPVAIAPAQEIIARSTLSELSLLDGKTFDIDAPKDGSPAVIVRKRPPALKMRFTRSPDGALPSPYECHADGAALRTSSGGTQDDAGGGGGERHVCTFRAADGRTYRIQEPTVVLRSPEAVLYFLGEYIRDPARSTEHSLLRVYQRGSSSAEGKLQVVRTDFMGRTWFITESATHQPGKPDDRSTQTLALVQQLINLHKSASEMPVSASVVVQ